MEFCFVILARLYQIGREFGNVPFTGNGSKAPNIGKQFE